VRIAFGESDSVLRHRLRAAVIFTFGLAACTEAPGTTGAAMLSDAATADDVTAGGFGAATPGGGNAGVPSTGGEPPPPGSTDGAAGIGPETGLTSPGHTQGQSSGDASAGGSTESGTAPTCGAGEQAAVSSGLPAACATCLCSACPKEFGTPTGMDDPAIAGDVEAGLELPGGSNAQGCDTNCWLFWSCMYMNGCAELNAFDVSGITNCLTSHCGSQYAAIGGKWPNDTDLCSVEKAKAGEQRACSTQCNGD
jgi:hypothetical protein